MFRTPIALRAGVALCALVIGAAAHAQTAAPAPAPTPSDKPASQADLVEDVVVTASRQGGQTLQKVPLAIQAFSGDQLLNRGVREATDLVTVIPGASQGEQVGSVIKTFSLRGVGAAGGIGDSPIGYYIDNVPFSIPNSPLAPPLRFVDIDRVEVLRGPQGTLYGQGSAGGTIIFHTRDPNLTRVEARGEASVSTMSDASALGYSASGAVSIPLVDDKLAIRVSGGYDKRPGYVDIYSATPATGPRVAKDANDITNRDIRAVVLFKPDDALTIRAQIAHFEPKQDYTQSISSLEPPQQWYSGAVKGYEQGNFDLYSLSIEYDAGFASLSSSTSYLSADVEYLTGQNFGQLGIGSLYNGTTGDSLSQEIQLRSSGPSPFHWVVGGFFQNAKSTFSFDANTNVVTLAGANTTHTRNYSGFGEVSYDLFGGKVVPLVGIRYFKDNRTLDASSPLTGSGFGRTRPDKVTYRANLSFFPSDALTAFLTVSTGFRSGITQTPFQASVLQSTGIPGVTALNPDTLTNYEAGMKARLFDGAINVGLNLYRIDFKDLQFGLTPSGIASFANVGTARTTGVDAEIRWRTPVRGLEIGGIANVNDSAFQRILPVVSAALPNVSDGARLSNTAKYNYRLDASFDRAVGADLRLIANASAARTGDRLMYDGFRVPAFSLYNASIGVRRGPVELALFGENLSDQRGPSFVRDSLLRAGPFPRTVGLRLRANYD